MFNADAPCVPAYGVPRFLIEVDELRSFAAVFPQDKMS
jgi:hypothetical protein